MDKEEFRIKLEEINRLVEKKDYKAAMEVVDSIDWRRVKNVHTLCVVGEIYAANKRYEDSKEIFLLAYHRAPIGKTILYRLIEISLKMKNVNEAMDFYEEYLEIAPNDSTQYVLKYKIEKVNKAPLEEQIKILEDYKEQEFTEKWSYELAKLYYQNGEKDKCLDLCNEMILWFSEGKYVLKAMELKNLMGKLTEKEKEKYEEEISSESSKKEAKEQSESEEKKTEDIPAVESSMTEEAALIDELKIDQRDVNNAESLQEKISKGIRDIFNGIKKESEEESELTEEEKEQSEADQIQEEMLKSFSLDEENKNIPVLEQEKTAEDRDINLKEMVSELDKKPEEPGESGKQEEISSEKENQEEKSEKESDSAEFEIPSEAPKAFNLDNMDFNLEDTILAAASAQGIDIPEDKEENNSSKDEKKENPEKQESFEEEIPMTEEDLREAEEEFLNGPVNKKHKNKKETIEDEDNDFSAIMEEIDEDFEDDEFAVLDDDDYILGNSSVDKEERELEKFVDSINPKKENLDIIPREKKLTKNEEKLFTYFAKVPGLREQIINTLYDVQISASDKTSRTGNIIVMGGRETGKTRLISGLIPAICSELKIEASKVAYVFADQINGKDAAAIVNKMAGGFLVIENANHLKKETVNQLNKAMEFRTDGLIVILEDEKIGMRKLIARFPKFTSKFTSMINIPVFTNDELVNFAKIYTRENGYTIDQMGMLALYNQISMGQKADQPMNIGSVKEMIDNAIAKSKGGIRKLKKKKINSDGYMVLYEKDFS